MAQGIYWLNDVERARIELLLPRGRRGAHRVDDRRIISGTCEIIVLRLAVNYRMIGRFRRMVT